MKDYILWLLFGDKRRSALFLTAILTDYYLFNLIFLIMKENFETKKGKVKAWLLSGKTITSKEAIEMWWCTRLAAVIKDLEDRDGLKIDRVRIYEDGTNYTRYWLKEEE